MSFRAPAYTPLCNRHWRFFLADPNRKVFVDDLAERQHLAVKAVYESLPPWQQEQLRRILPHAGTADLGDRYIFLNLCNSGASPEEIENFYRMLRSLNKRIAISLAYISGRNQE